MNSTKVSKRILALDILRGVTIAGMIMVNNPGSWGRIIKSSVGTLALALFFKSL